MALDDDDIAKITALFTAGMKPLLERVDAVEKVEAPDVAQLIADAMAAIAKPDDKPDDKVDAKPDAALLAKIEALEESVRTEQTNTKTATAKAAAEKMLSALRGALTKGKVSRVEHAVAHLHHAQKRISLDDIGQPVIRFDRTGAGGAYQDHLPLEKGMEEWLGTDDGKSFLPAKQIHGSDVHNSQRRGTITPDGKVNTRNLISQALAQAQSQ